jgi:hypothetical protein
MVSGKKTPSPPPIAVGREDAGKTDVYIAKRRQRIIITIKVKAENVKNKNPCVS